MHIHISVFYLAVWISTQSLSVIEMTVGRICQQKAVCVCYEFCSSHLRKMSVRKEKKRNVRTRELNDTMKLGNSTFLDWLFQKNDTAFAHLQSLLFTFFSKTAFKLNKQIFCCCFFVKFNLKNSFCENLNHLGIYDFTFCDAILSLSHLNSIILLRMLHCFIHIFIILHFPFAK